MPTKKAAAKDESPSERVFQVMHAMIGPAHSIYMQGQNVKESQLGHEINTALGPHWYKWDVQRLIDLGAIVETSDDAETSGPTQEGPVPEVQHAAQIPVGGVPIVNAQVPVVSTGASTTDMSTAAGSTGGGAVPSVDAETAARIAAIEAEEAAAEEAAAAKAAK